MEWSKGIRYERCPRSTIRILDYWNEALGAISMASSSKYRIYSIFLRMITKTVITDFAL